jgi:dipeptidase E
MDIIAIGGGDVGSGETAAIDRELVRLARGNRLLFIPTASDDDPGYVESVRQGYGRLGLSVEALLLWGEDGDPETAAHKIADADLIYVGGGNTKAMLERWRKFGVDEALRRHLDAGKPAGGLSAGALCWFRVGNSDWPQYEGITGVNTARLDCLGFVDLVLCPHTSREGFRLGEFREMMRTEQGVGVGLDDGCAIQIHGDTYRILASIPGAVAHRIEWREGAVDERELSPHDTFRPLAEL